MFNYGIIFFRNCSGSINCLWSVVYGMVTFDWTCPGCDQLSTYQGGHSLAAISKCSNKDCSRHRLNTRIWQYKVIKTTIIRPHSSVAGDKTLTKSEMIKWFVNMFLTQGNLFTLDYLRGQKQNFESVLELRK